MINIQKSMENHHVSWVKHGKTTISIAIFYSYVGLPEGIIHVWWLNLQNSGLRRREAMQKTRKRRLRKF